MFRADSPHLKFLAAALLIAITLELVPFASGSVPFARSVPAVTLTPSISFSPSNPGIGQIVTFTGSATGGTSPYTFNWNFGDGVVASGSMVKHIFISLQTFTVTLTVTDSVGATGSVQNSVYVGSLNPRVNCTPTIVRISDITANHTGTTSLNTSPFSPGITTTVSGGAAKRWLTPGPTPSGWHSPGPSCIITNNFGQTISVYVEIDGIKRASITTEDSNNGSYDATNGGGSAATFSDSTFNTFDPAIVSNYGSSCTSASDPTCYGRIHNEMDHDWKAAGYCGTGTACDPNALSSQTTASSTLIDFQGFVYWDNGNLGSSDHQFSGWELHPLTGWRVHHAPLTVSISNSPSAPSAGQTVTFTGTASGGTGSYTFTWDFGDGSTTTGNPATHSYLTGSYNVHLSVTDSNGATGVVSKTVVVGGSTPDFSISSNPTSLTIQSGAPGTSTITLSSLNSFSGTVSLTASVSPSGLTATLTPTGVSLSSGGSGSSTLNVSSSTPNSYTVTVTGTSGFLSHSTSVTVNVGSTPDFSISSSPASLTIQSGSSGTSIINLASLNSFSGTVTLSASASPSGLTTSVSPTSASLSSGGSGSSTLAVSSSIPGPYTVNVTGTSGSLSHSTTVTVTVTATPDFSISGNPASLAVQSGFPATSTITLTSLNSFSGTVSLLPSVSPPGLTASLNPTSVNLSSGASAGSTLTLSSSTAGNYTVIVTGTSGALSHSTTVIVTSVSSLVASDSAVGPSSLATAGGGKLVQDSAGRTIAVYVDSSGRIGLAFSNSNPMVAGWSTPVKSPIPTSPYAWPAAVLLSLTSLRIIAGGGSGAGVITDIPVTVQRDGQNNITGFIFGTPTTLDSSGLGRYPAAVLAHNGDILLAWAWQNSTRTMVKSLRWDPSTGWTGFSGSSISPDIVLLSVNVTWFVPNMIERPDNNNVYLLGNRLSAPPSTLAYNRASWNGSSWSWGPQNLTYETNASSGVEDPVSLAWDPTTSRVVVSYGITGTTSFGVFTLNSLDQKTHLDTPPLSITERDWGTISVHITTGDYYIFLMNVNTDGGSGTLGYIKHPAGDSWSSTLTLLDSATDNQGLNMRATGTSTTLDLLYAEGTSEPAKIKFVRLSPFNPPNFNISATPTTVTFQTGSPGTSTITLTGLYNFTGTISLSTTVSPSGPTASLSPASVTLTNGGTATSTLTVSSTTSGTFTVTVQGASGSISHSTTVTVIVTDRQPVVSFTESATTAPTGTSITLTISASDPDGTVTAIKVVWGDGTIDNLPGTTTSDSHAYSLAGSYQVYVNATDNANLITKSAVATKSITDRPPVVSFTESVTTATTGTSITLTITSSDPDGIVNSIKVVWGDGTIDTLAGTATTDSHSYVSTGSSTTAQFQVYVNATDNSGSTTKSATATKTISDRPPTVSFTESTTTAQTGTPITLTITSGDLDGTVSSLKVAWGDGTIDTLAGTATTDSHSYTSTGSSLSAQFQVYVNATDNSGSTTKSAVATKTINNRPPEVSFTETLTTANTGQSITLTITSSDLDGTISNLKVSWGDGTVDTLAGTATTDSHAYALTGNSPSATFQVYVNATDNSGATTRSTAATKTINDRPPTVSFTESVTTAPTGASITLTINASDPDGTLTAIKVVWGDGTIDNLAGTATSDSHAYSLAGSYEVYVNATDNANLTTKSVFATKSITDRPPVVSFTESATTAPTGTSITLAITSSDPDGTVNTLKVVWGDGTIDTLAGTATTDSHAYTSTGNGMSAQFQIYVNATDNSGLTTKSLGATKTITDRAPTVSFTESATTANTGVTITLTISSSDVDGTISQTIVNWGDGTTHTLTGAATSDSHAYANTGNAKNQAFTVTVTVNDNSGSTVSSTAVKTINDQPPNVSFTENLSTANPGQTITLTITASDPDGTVAQTLVNWGDGTNNTVIGQTDSHSYSAGGTYTVNITAIDNSRSTSSAFAVKTIIDLAPTVSFTESATTAQTGSSITLTISASDADGSISSIKVFWGDGTIDTLPGVATTDSHSYSSTGSSPSATFQVYVNATDNANLTTKSASSTKTITDKPPTVGFTESTTTATTGQSITLTITSSDPDGNVSRLKVSWGDGSVDTLTGNATTDSHAYASTGNSPNATFQVYVNATDNSGSTTQSAIATKTINNRPPTISFTESTTTAKTGQSITLTITALDPDGTVGNLIVFWGDGTLDSLSGTATTHGHGYSVAGSYNVYVNATDSAGLITKSAVASKTITDQPPVVGFTESATTATTGAAVNLTITSSDPDGIVTGLEVVWGDGTVDTLAGTATTDSHSYTLAGTYTVYVNSTDNANLTTKSGVASKTITNRPPAVSFAESLTTAPTGSSISLTISATDPDGIVNTLSVSWGDGTIDNLPGTSTSDSHSYSVAGSYTVYVNATDNSGSTTKSGIAAKIITDRSPIARFTESATTALTGGSISFDAGASFDPDGTIVGYAWNFGDGVTGSGATVNHSYASTGNALNATFTASLTVTDNSGNTATSTATKTIRDNPPVAAFAFSPNTTPVQGQPVSFDGSSSSDPDGSISSYLWNFGDGATGGGNLTTHAYSVNGTYTVSLTVIDNSGSAGTTSTLVTIGLDVNPPTWPANKSLSISNIHSTNNLTSLTLSWSPASDDGAIANYWIYINGRLNATVVGSTRSHSVTGLKAASYTFEIEAVDYGGLLSRNGPTATLSIRQLAGDINNDCQVNIVDLTLVAISFGTQAGSPGFNPAADLNGDGVINIADLAIVAINFGQHC